MDRRYQYAATTYDPAKKACSTQPLSVKYGCLEQADRANHVNEREERDLVAQETTAAWTYVMSATALGGTFISVIGIYLVWDTLAHTARAVEVANEANALTRMEQRPWVTIEREVLCNFDDIDELSGQLSWNHNLVNKGKSPAYGIETYSKITKCSAPFYAANEIENYANECARKAKRGSIPIIFPSERTDYIRYASFMHQAYDVSRNDSGEFEKKKVEGDYFGFLFCITYRQGMALDSPIGVEARAFEISDQKDVIGPWRHKMLEISYARIVR